MKGSPFDENMVECEYERAKLVIGKGTLLSMH